MLNLVDIIQLALHPLVDVEEVQSRVYCIYLNCHMYNIAAYDLISYCLQNISIDLQYFGAFFNVVLCMSPILSHTIPLYYIYIYIRFSY